MNIVCDTNILVSGLLFGGNPRNIIRAASRGLVTNYISAPILRELEDVLSRPKFGLRSEEVHEIMALVRDTFDFIEPHLVIEAVTSDPDDDRILEAAVASNAQYIVSGDKHLLKLGQWEEIPIVTAEVFISEVTDGQKRGQTQNVNIAF